MHIIVKARSFFEARQGTIRETELFARNRIISINNISFPAEPPPFSSRYLNAENLLVLYFDDVEEGPNAMTAEQAKRIADFALRPGDDRPIIVHCSAGISRSGAVGDVLNLYFNRYIDDDETEYRAFELRHPDLAPNAHVRKLLEEKLHRRLYARLLGYADGRDVRTVSTGFGALDGILGGLRNGKLYGLATYNFHPDHFHAYFFAADMIANSGIRTFFHSAPAASERLISDAFASKVLFRVGDTGDREDAAGNFPRADRVFFDRGTEDDTSEAVCERLRTRHRKTPFAAAFVDLTRLHSRHVRFLGPQDETYVIRSFRELAGELDIPIILVMGLRALPEKEKRPDVYRCQGLYRAMLKATEAVFLLSFDPEYRLRFCAGPRMKISLFFGLAGWRVLDLYEDFE